MHRKGSSLDSQTSGWLKYWQIVHCQSQPQYWEKHFIHNERNLSSRSLAKWLKVTVNFGGHTYVCACSQGRGSIHVYWCICTCKHVCVVARASHAVSSSEAHHLIYWGQISHLHPELSGLTSFPHQPAHAIPSLPLQCWDSRPDTSRSGMCVGSRGPNWLSGVYSNHLICCAISQNPFLFHEDETVNCKDQ